MTLIHHPLRFPLRGPLGFIPSFPAMRSLVMFGFAVQRESTRSFRWVTHQFGPLCSGFPEGIVDEDCKLGKVM